MGQCESNANDTDKNKVNMKCQEYCAAEKDKFYEKVDLENCIHKCKKNSDSNNAFMECKESCEDKFDLDNEKENTKDEFDFGKCMDQCESNANDTDKNKVNMK